MFRKILLSTLVIVTGLYFYNYQNQNTSTPDQVSEVDTTDRQAEEVTEESVGSETASLETALVGIWRSTEDSAFVREFTVNTYVDSYTDETNSTGSWRLFTASEAPANGPITFAPDSTYLELSDGAELLYFEIIDLTDEKLVLIYLNRGGALEFMREG